MLGGEIFLRLVWQKYSVQVDKANRMYLIIVSSSGGLEVFFVKDNNAFYRGRASKERTGAMGRGDGL